MDKKDFIAWASKLSSTYQANEQVRHDISQIDLVAIVGPTGVGKTTLINKLDIPFVVSDVSRKRRPGEENEKTYQFREDYLAILQEIKEGKYVQFLVSSSGEFYGTRRDSYPENGVCTMAIYANVIPKFVELGFKKVHKIFIMPPGYVEWMRRIGQLRSGDFDSRLEEAKQSIKMAMLDSEYTFILNDNPDLAVEEIRQVIAGEQVDAHRSQLAYDTAGILLERLGETDLGF